MNKIFASILFLLTPIVSFANHDEGIFHSIWHAIPVAIVIAYIGYRIIKK